MSGYPWKSQLEMRRKREYKVILLRKEQLSCQ